MTQDFTAFKSKPLNQHADLLAFWLVEINYKAESF